MQQNKATIQSLVRIFILLTLTCTNAYSMKSCFANCCKNGSEPETTKSDSMPLLIENLDKEESKASMAILKLCSFVNTDHIPRWLLNNYLRAVFSDRLSGAQMKYLIKEHPFLSPEDSEDGKCFKFEDDDLFFIHREVQDQTREHLAEKFKVQELKLYETELIRIADSLMPKFLDSETADEVAIRRSEKALSYVISLLRHSCVEGNVLSEKKLVELTLKAALFFNDLRKSHIEQFLNDVLCIVEGKWNKDSIKDIYAELFDVYFYTGQLEKVSKIPQLYRSVFMEALCYENLKDFDNAEKFYLQAYDNEKESLETNHLKKEKNLYCIANKIGGFYFFVRGDLESAKRYYSLALNTLEESKIGQSRYYKIGRLICRARLSWIAYAQNLDSTYLDEVIKTSKELVELNPKNAIYWHNLAIYCQEGREFELAERYFIEALRLEKYFYMYCGYGRFLYQQQRYSEAIEQFKFALSSPSPHVGKIAFTKAEKLVLDDALQREIEQHGTMWVDSEMQKLLAYYYLIKCHSELAKLKVEELKQEEEIDKYLKKLKGNNLILGVGDESGLAKRMLGYIKEYLRKV